MNVLRLSTDLQSSLIRELKLECTTTAMLKMIVERAAEVLQAGACTIFIVEPEGEIAIQRAGTGYQMKFVDEAQCRVTPAHQVSSQPTIEEKLGLTGWILSTGKSFLAQTPDELAAHPHRSGEHDPKQLPREELILQTFLGVPLRGLRGEVVGLIKAERRMRKGKPTASFSVDDQILLETFARVASKCLVYLEMVRQGSTNAAVTAWARDVIGEAAATEGELDSFLDIVVNVMASAMQADSCAIYLIDESRQTLTQRAGIGSQAPRYVIRSYPLPTREKIEAGTNRVGLTAFVAATGESFYARDFAELSTHPHHKGEFDRWNFPQATRTICGAFLGVPLRVGGTIIGVLKVENTSEIDRLDPRHFPREARWRFEVLAQDIALAIMRLQQQSRARYQVISDAQPTIFEILRGGLDVQELVGKVVKATATLFNARACALFLKEGNRLIQPRWAAYGWAERGPKVREYKLVNSEEIKDDPSENEKVGLTVWIAVKQEKFTARSNLELIMHPHHKGTFDADNFYPGEGCESFMGVPLTVGGELVGVLKVETKVKEVEPGIEEVTYFSDQDELVFDLIANSVAIAIENASLLDSQRLAEQIRGQSQNLLLDLHGFVSSHWQATSSLEQAADLLRGKSPKIASIVDNYAALLQPEFRLQHLQAILDLVAPYGDFLEGSHAFCVLYRAFVDAMEIESLADISRRCSSHEALADPQLLEPQFFLTKAATLLVRMYRRIASALRGEGSNIPGGSLDRVIVHLRVAREEAETLYQPEQDIICRILDLWLQIVTDAREGFRPVKNPYVAGPPIDPERDSPFFGRQDTFAWVAENLQGAHQENVLVLHGERRMGKTSILLQLERGELGKALRESSDKPLCPVFVDLQGFADQGTHLFLRRIARRISKQVSAYLGMSEQSQVPVPSDSQFEKTPYDTFDGFLERASGCLGSTLLVLMLDEFEALDKRVADGKVDADIYDQLRHQMQHRRNFTCILAGTHKLEELSADYRGIVFTVGLHREVGFMDETEARALVQEPVKGQVIYEDSAVEELLRATHGHPYLLQLLCQHLISEMNRREESNFITLGDVSAAIEYFVHQRGGHLKYIWDESTELERLALAALAVPSGSTQRYVSWQELCSRLRCASTEIDEAIHRLSRRRLIEYGSSSVVDKSKALYGITMEIFRLWLHHHFPLGTLLE